MVIAHGGSVDSVRPPIKGAKFCRAKLGVETISVHKTGFADQAKARKVFVPLPSEISDNLGNSRFIIRIPVNAYM